MNRPTSVTVLGILNIVFAAFGLMGIAFSIAIMFVHPAALNMKNPVLDLMQQNPAYAMYTNISMVIGAVFTLVLGLAGIGLLMLRPWGRWLSIAYAVFSIISLIVNSLINYYFLVMPLIDKVAAAQPGQEKAAAMGGIVGMVGGICIGPIYPVILLIFMYRPNVKAAFGSQDSADQFRV
jgi:hypothetical protein